MRDGQVRPMHVGRRRHDHIHRRRHTTRTPTSIVEKRNRQRHRGQPRPTRIRRRPHSHPPPRPDAQETRPRAMQEPNRRPNCNPRLRPHTPRPTAHHLQRLDGVHDRRQSHSRHARRPRPKAHLHRFARPALKLVQHARHGRDGSPNDARPRLPACSAKRPVSSSSGLTSPKSPRHETASKPSAARSRP
jgi:hypothetical protein